MEENEVYNEDVSVFSDIDIQKLQKKRNKEKLKRQRLELLRKLYMKTR